MPCASHIKTASDWNLENVQCFVEFGRPLSHLKQIALPLTPAVSDRYVWQIITTIIQNKKNGERILFTSSQPNKICTNHARKPKKKKTRKSGRFVLAGSINHILGVSKKKIYLISSSNTYLFIYLLTK